MASAPVGSSHPSRDVYEDFQPPWELKDEQGAHTLILTLPNFGKNQITVAVDRKLHFLSIQGQRLVEANHKWARFSHALRIPDNCNLDQIRAFFGNGWLSVSLPKVESSIVAAEPKDKSGPAQQVSKPPRPPPIAVGGEKQMDGGGKGGKRTMDKKRKVATEAAAAGRGDKWLLVNAGAAAAVLVAYGAYLSSNFWAYGMAKN